MTCKVCIKCKNKLNLFDFYSNPHSKDGYRSDCKKCFKESSRRNRQKNWEHYQEYDKSRKVDKTSGAYLERLERGRAKYWEDTVKRKAISRVSYAVKVGFLIKSDVCEYCGSIEHICAHHSSYSKDMWEQVTWLCKRCHQNLHREFERENSIERRNHEQ